MAFRHDFENGLKILTQEGTKPTFLLKRAFALISSITSSSVEIFML